MQIRIQDHLLQKLKIKFELKFIQDQVQKFNEVSGNEFDKQPITTQASAIFQVFLVSPLHQAFISENNEIIKLISKDSGVQQKQIVIYKKHNILDILSKQPKYVEKSFKTPIIVQISQHCPYDIITDSIVTSPIQLKASLNMIPFSLLLQQPNLTVNSSYLLPGAKILLKEFQICELGGVVYVKSYQFLLLGGGVLSDINKHKEQYQEEYKNYFINQVNENVKSILLKGVDVYEEIKKVVSKKQIVCKFSKLTLTEASK
ncbi:Conserved_hypothetical protein [Hexamita inflata]|uniref:Uncharacterized protein n=1 Tax=Hexamita inflata TaxID=28002 RepID=A0AA86NMV2_9EUKA|nr:Conserved hypothetical protein [Hexamita inflata]